MSEIKINIHTAETVYIEHPQASYGIFCYNSIGDLFLNSDWGFYGYAWRSYGEDFKKFLAQCNADYIVGKFEINYPDASGKKMPPHQKKAVTILVEEFIKAIKDANV